MKAAFIIAVIFWAEQIASAETGFIDRSVVKDGTSYRYQVYVPADYSPATQWPLVVDLHGSGWQGDDGIRPTAMSVGVAQRIREGRAKYPFIALFPQAQPSTTWVGLDMQQLVDAQIDQTINEFRIDLSRVYLTGFSMGATGAYRLAFRWPNRFAALVAIAGRVEIASAQNNAAREAGLDSKTNTFAAARDPFVALAEGLSHMPMWIVHSVADETVPVAQSQRLVSETRRRSMSVRYTEYSDAPHVASAHRAFSSDELWEWLLSQRLPLK